MVDVTVIIVTWNAADLIEKCLESVAIQQDEKKSFEIEVIVVDNASTDETVEIIRRTSPEVEVISNSENLGFAAANNIAIGRARGRYLLLLNSDARLMPGALKEMLEGAQRAPGVGLVAPKLLNEDGSLQRSIRGFPTLWRIASEFLFFRNIDKNSDFWNGYYAGGNQHRQNCFVDWVMGACMLVPAVTVEDVGLLDESFFMYNEETDWQRRMHLNGWKVLFLPEAEVEHLGGGSSRTNWGEMYRVQLASHLRYAAYHFSRNRWLIARRVILFGLWLRWLRSALQRRGNRHEMKLAVKSVRSIQVPEDVASRERLVQR